jgi:predicted Zn-dependent peptidase
MPTTTPPPIVSFRSTGRCCAALIGVGLLAVTAATARAQEAAPAGSPTANRDPEIPFEKYQLPNGLEVILAPDNRVPLVAVNVWYHVGSGNEVPGKSGFAHLFEHMLFQGSQHVGGDRHFEILKQIGGSGVNGTTNTDRTNYYEVVPSNLIETALWLESDRMGYLLPLVTAPSLKNQIDVVRNERRQNYENVPYGPARFVLSAALYPEGHPYRYLTIGDAREIESASLEEVRGFYQTWYVPANATLLLAGDFDPAQAKALVERWFGGFPASRRPPVRAAIPMPSVKRTRIEVADDQARMRRLTYAWHTPARYAAGDAELDILADALSRTGTGRLYRRLVHESQLASSVSAYQASRQLSSYFAIEVTLRPDADLAQVEAILEEELGRILATPISRAELDRHVVNREAGLVWSLEGLMARAEILQAYNHYLGDPDSIGRDLARYRSATPEGVRDVAARWLQRDARVEMLVVPGGKP